MESFKFNPVAAGSEILLPTVLEMLLLTTYGLRGSCQLSLSRCQLRARVTRTVEIYKERGKHEI